MNNNTNKKARRNIRCKKVPVRKNIKRNTSHPKQNIYNIFKTKKIRKRKITLTRHLYIRYSNKNTLLNIPKKSSLPRIKSTNK